MDRARAELLQHTLARMVERCPRLVRHCYWAGTSAIALEELGHRESFDLDFHTQEPMLDTRPMLAELQRAFPRAVELVAPPDEFGSGFTASLRVKRGVRVPVQVFAGFEAVPDRDLTPSSTVPGLRRITLRRYVQDKVQCVAERLESRDLVDLAAAVRARPSLERVLARAVAAQDRLVLAERLLAWTDAVIREDLRSHADVDPDDALGMRDRMLRMLRGKGP